MVVHFLFAQGVFCDIKMIQIVAFCLKDVVYGSGIPLKHLFKRTSIFQVWLLLSVTMSRRPRIIQRRFDNSFFLFRSSYSAFDSLPVSACTYIPNTSSLRQFPNMLFESFWQCFLTTKTCGFCFLFNRPNSLIKSYTIKAKYRYKTVPLK